MIDISLFLREVQFNEAFISIAQNFASLSRAERKKVGAILVKDGNIISCGFNGTISNFDNNCEDDNGITKKEVLHAETNCLAKIARSTQSSEGSTMYTTLSPCFDCAKMIIQCGIVELFYLEDYRDLSGLALLREAKIKVTKIELKNE